MNPDALLLAEFSERALIRGDEAFFDLKTAQAVVDYCKDHDFAISGMEGVTVEKDGLRPRLDCIADFSRNPGASWEETVTKWDEGARRVLEAWETSCPDVHVSMTVIASEEWIQPA
jgi:hypothetical protein